MQAPRFRVEASLQGKGSSSTATLKKMISVDCGLLRIPEKSRRSRKVTTFLPGWNG